MTKAQAQSAPSSAQDIAAIEALVSQLTQLARSVGAEWASLVAKDLQYGKIVLP
jgi:hypothetical protein